MQHIDRRTKIGATGILLTLVVLGWLLHWWRTPPVVQYDNLKYIQLLRTAVSSRNREHVRRVEQAVDRQLVDGHLSEAERRHFARIITMTRDGQWDQADRLSFDFEAAQLNRRR